MILDIEVLRYFMVVANTQHMTKAAKILNLSQPSLSLAIRRLESEIGFELFTRRKRSIELNDYGRVFLESVTAMEHELNLGLSRMTEMKKMKENFINLCVPTSPIKQWLMEALLAEGYNLKFTSLPNNWQQALLDAQLDLVITIGEAELPQIGRMILKQSELVFVSGKNHPLAAQPYVSIDELKKYQFSSTSTRHTPLVCARKQLEAKGVDPNVTFFGNNTTDILDSVASSERLGLVVKDHLPKRDDLAILSVRDLDICLPLYLYWKITNPKAFIQHVIKYISEFYSERID